VNILVWEKTALGDKGNYGCKGLIFDLTCKTALMTIEKVND